MRLKGLRETKGRFEMTLEERLRPVPVRLGVDDRPGGYDLSGDAFHFEADVEGNGGARIQFDAGLGDRREAGYFNANIVAAKRRRL